MQAKPSISLYLDSRRAKKSGKYPLKLQLVYKSIQKYYPLGLDLTKEEFQLAQNPILRECAKKEKSHFKALNNKMTIEINKAQVIIDALPLFTLLLFEKKYLPQNAITDDVYKLYEFRVKQLITEGRLGTAENYSQSCQSLKTFSKNLSIGDVTVGFLKSYERWLKETGRSISTVGIYLRPLRAVINIAIQENSYWNEIYPFGKGRYQIPEPRNVKKALPNEVLHSIWNFKPIKKSATDRAVDFFKFIYLGNGLNPKDIAFLKYSNIDDDMVRFTRAKTALTNRKSTQIRFYLHPELAQIIEKWGKPIKPDNYIFKIIDDSMTLSQKDAAIHQFIKNLNRGLKNVAKQIGYNGNITTMTARHSFATSLKRKRLSIAFISESLGHSSSKTTEYYLSSFEDSSKKEASLMLTDFG